MKLLPKTQSNQNGFTLVELLVVIVILAILGVVGMTLFSSTQSRARDAKRKEDISRLLTFFLKKLAPHYGGAIPEVTTEFITCLENYSWPGNVRELENVIESIIALSAEGPLDVQDIPARIRGEGSRPDNLKDAVLAGFVPFEEAERQFETEIITRALEKTGFTQTKAADLLGISRRILKYKMDKLGIIAPDEE